MDALLYRGETTRHHADVVDFGKRMKDGYKVQYWALLYLLVLKDRATTSGK